MQYNLHEYMKLNGKAMSAAQVASFTVLAVTAHVQESIHIKTFNSVLVFIFQEGQRRIAFILTVTIDTLLTYAAMYASAKTLVTSHASFALRQGHAVLSLTLHSKVNPERVSRRVSNHLPPRLPRSFSLNVTETPMADNNLSISFDFSSMSDADLHSSPLKWYNPVDRDHLELINGVGLKLFPKPQTDFWCKPYYSPPVQRNSGHALLYKVPSSVQRFTVEVNFSLSGKALYDQCGLMVYMDDTHWLKAGIEIDNDKPRMSCVITNTTSDWSYQTWHTTKEIAVRSICTLYNEAVCECRVEFKNETGEWTFLREGPVMVNHKDIQAGIMLCAPKKKDESKEMNAVFQRLDINQSRL